MRFQIAHSLCDRPNLRNFLNERKIKHYYRTVINGVKFLFYIISYNDMMR